MGTHDNFCMKNYWQFSVAPMMDCTDKHIRMLMRQISKHALLYTEMEVAQSLYYTKDRKKLLDSDSYGRIITNQNLQIKSFSGIFAVGDCAVVGSAKRPASGVFAVKVVNTLVQNLKKDIEGRSLKKWFP